MCAVKQFKMLAAATVAVVAMAAGVTAQTGAQYCEISLRNCPEAYNGDTLRVPLSVVGLSAKINACPTSIIDSAFGGDPPNIMFIIDHTSSMTASGGGNDANGNRFRVARALIDSVYKKFPKAKVGVAVFYAGLYLNPTRSADPNLVEFKGIQYNPADRESYMPLMQLDQPAQGGGFYNGDSPTAYDVYRDMFMQAGNSWGIRNPANRNATLPEVNGTNITIGFEAALEQFNGQVGVKPENQYIIFLSDGEPGIGAGATNGSCSGPGNTQGDNPRCERQDYFRQGEIPGFGKIPTTYTVFLTARANTLLIDTLVTMTNNIRYNGYSAVNPSSAIWAIQGSAYTALIDTMMNNIITPMLTQTNSSPRRMTVVSAGQTDSTTANEEDSTFGFGRMLPIDTLTVAPVNMGITYLVTVDTTGSDGRDSTYTYEQKIDYRFWIQRTASPGNNWQGSQGLTQSCQDKPSMELLYGGVHIDTISSSMGNLTLRFNKNDFFEYTKDNVVIEIRTSKGVVLDTLPTTALTNARDGTITIEWDFERLYVENSGIVVGNNKLEHNTTTDDIVLFFRNKYIPLDTLTLVVPYITHQMAFNVKHPSGEPKLKRGNGDKDTVKAGDLIDISALLLNNAGVFDDVFKVVGAGGGEVRWVLLSLDGATITPDPNESSKAKFSSTKVGPYEVTATFTSADGKFTATGKLTIIVVDGFISVLTPDRVIPQSKPPEEATVIAPMVILSGEFAAGPNPISKRSGIVNFYRQGRRIANCEVRIYDATGNHIKKIKIKDNAIGTQAKRIVGSWDLTDKKGKIVSEGTYLVKGVIKTSDGKSEKVSVIIGIR